MSAPEPAAASPANHFATVAAEYAAFRPRYPAGLYDWLAAEVADRDAAWDCACGSGQVSLDLAARFAHVEATDASAEQIRAAPAHPRVRYRVATAEASGLAAGSVSLVTVGQALHWFDCARFYAEARRVLRPRGVLAVWSYQNCRLADPLDQALVTDLYERVLGPYWPAERAHVDDGYARLALPQPAMVTPHFAMSVAWTHAQFIGYLRSWSATARCVAATGIDPTAPVAEALAAGWGEHARVVRWPLTVHAARRESLPG